MMPSRDRDKDERQPVRSVGFPLGNLYMTPGVQAGIPPSELLRAMRRHAAGDWGDLGAEDKRSNDAALKTGGRLLSAYHATDGTKFWIITEADRSVTTALLPDEY
jgi:hypothetical protein